MLAIHSSQPASQQTNQPAKARPSNWPHFRCVFFLAVCSSTLANTLTVRSSYSTCQELKFLCPFWSSYRTEIVVRENMRLPYKQKSLQQWPAIQVGAVTVDNRWTYSRNLLSRGESLKSCPIPKKFYFLMPNPLIKILLILHLTRLVLNCKSPQHPLNCLNTNSPSGDNCHLIMGSLFLLYTQRVQY